MAVAWWGDGDPLSSRNPTNLLLSLLISLLLFSPIKAQDEGRGMLRGMLSSPDQCLHNGVTGQCKFFISCLVTGDVVVGKCGGGFIYSCCIPQAATVRSEVRADVLPIVREAPSPPVRSGLVPASSARFQKMEGHEQRTIQRQYYNEPECGIPRYNQNGFSKRIIGGNEASFGEFPWQAHIRISGYQCGGVIVNRHFVATAAHCVHKARLNQITVHLGEHDTKDTGDYHEPFPKETFAVVQKIIHPNFKYMLTQPDRYDIAVLRLSRPAPYRENILPICLPDANEDYEGHAGIVAGWGKTDNSFGKTGTNILRKVMVPIINNEECLRWHHRKGIDVKLHYEMFCAGHAEGQMDACLGDSGGPLVVPRNGRWTLVGITSAGFGCAVDHQPGIYHKVSVTSGWVARNVVP